MPSTVTTKRDLSQSHNNKIAKANAYITALRQIGQKDADLLADAMAKQLEKTQQEVNEAHSAAERRASVKAESRSDDKDLFAAVQGVISLVELSDPELAKKLPTYSNLKSVDIDFFTGQLIEALGGGKRYQPTVEMLTRAKAKRLESQRSYQSSVTEQIQLRNGKASLDELQMLMLQAAAFIRRNALPGSPAYAVFSKPKSASSKKGDATKPSSDGKAATDAHAATPAPQPQHPVTPAPVVTPPAPAPAQQVTVTLGTADTQPSAPALMNGVHA